MFSLSPLNLPFFSLNIYYWSEKKIMLKVIKIRIPALTSVLLVALSQKKLIISPFSENHLFSVMFWKWQKIYKGQGKECKCYFIEIVYLFLQWYPPPKKKKGICAWFWTSNKLFRLTVSKYFFSYLNSLSQLTYWRHVHFWPFFP